MLRALFRRLRARFLLAAFACAAALQPVLVWAQEEGAEEAAPKSFVPNYTLVILLIALVMLTICKPTHRADAPKPRQH